MVFYLIGLGLGDAEDITVKGLNTVKKCVRVYLEAYTSILSCALDKSKLEHFYGKEVIMADRELVEQRSGESLSLLGLPVHIDWKDRIFICKRRYSWISYPECLRRL